MACVSQLMKLRSNDISSYLYLEFESRARPLNQAHTFNRLS